MSAEDDIEALVERAKALHRIRRYPQSLEMLHRALTMEPDRTDVLCWIAMTYYRLGEWARVLEYADLAVASDPEEEHGHRLRSCALEEMGRSAEAVEAAEEAIYLDPEGPYPLGQLASAYAAAHRWEEALETADRLTEVAPHDAYAFWVMAWVHHQQGHWTEAESFARQALSVDAEYCPALGVLGRALCQQDRNKEGMDALFQALQLDPTYSWSQQRLLYEIDRYGFASLEEYVRARTDPALMARAEQKGELKARARRKIEQLRAREAIPELLQALRRTPEDLGLLAVLTMAYLNCANYPTALENADRMIRLAPHDARGHWRRALVLSSMARRSPADRASALEGALLSSAEAVRILPKEPDYHYTLAYVQLESGRQAEAEQTAKGLAKLAPEWESSYLILARIYARLNRWILAEVYLRKVLALNPRNYNAMCDLARSLWEQGKYRESATTAKQAFRTALASKPPTTAS